MVGKASCFSPASVLQCQANRALSIPQRIAHRARPRRRTPRNEAGLQDVIRDGVVDYFFAKTNIMAAIVNMVYFCLQISPGVSSFSDR